MKLKYNPKEKYTRANYCWKIFSIIAFIYTLACMGGINHYLNFTPSSEWTITSITLAMILGLFCGISLTRGDKNNSGIGYAFLCSFGIFFLLAFGLGPALTSHSSVVVEKDIVGTKRHYKNGYWINSADLLEGESAAVINITKDQFNTIPGQVRMHVTLKQSFFGTTVEQYDFLRDQRDQSNLK